MHCSNRTLISATGAMLVLATFWTLVDLTVMSNAAAQTGPPAASRTMKKGELFAQLSRSRIEAILAEPIPDVKFQKVPLRAVLVELKPLTGINMYFDQEEIGDMIDPDVPVDVDVAANSMTFRTLIEDFILEPNDLVFVIRDNFLKIMSYDKSLYIYEIRVHDCRDLLAAMSANPPDEDGRLILEGEGIDPTDGSGGASGVRERKTVSDRTAREQQLIRAIYVSARSEDSPWDDWSGGATSGKDDFGTITAIDGLLIVRQTCGVQEQVEHFLELLRQTMKKPVQSPAVNQ